MTGSGLANIAYLVTIILFAGYGLNLWRASRAVGPRGRAGSGPGPNAPE